MTRSLQRLALTALLGTVGYTSPGVASADSICGPGKELASNEWACEPAQQRRTTQYRAPNRTAAQLNAAAGILGFAAVFASQLAATDNAGEAPPDLSGFGTKSREQNRRGLLELQKGNWDKARKLFDAAAINARKAQNFKDEMENRKNEVIVRALEALSAGRRYEAKGDFRGASREYLKATMAAAMARDSDLRKKIAAYNEGVIAKARKVGRESETIPNTGRCERVNGKEVCQK